jgi:outer membrane autotransporter protein
MDRVKRARRRALPPARRVPRAVLAVATALAMNVVPAQAQQPQLSIFDVTELFKFKAHKDNPTQIVLGTPVGLVVAGAVLVLLPSVLNLMASSFSSTGTTTGPYAQAMSCPVFADAGTLLTEDSCAWAKVSGQWTSQSGTTSGLGLYRLGGQKEVAPDWFLGGALGAGASWTQDGSRSSGTGQTFDGSVALKHTIGPWLLAGALGFSTSSMHTTQSGGPLQSDVNVYTGGLRLRGAYDFAFASWYLRPRVDLDLQHTTRPGFSASGQGVAVLAVDGFSKTSIVATPMVELGGRFALGEKTIVRPYIAAGASYFPDNSMTVSATFVGPVASLGGFQATVSSPSVVANLEAGLQIYQAHGFEAKVEYALSAGDNTLSQSASLRGAWHF